jgi:hypothetical protein
VPFRGVCAHCGSAELEALVHAYGCLRCGRLTHTDGTALQPDPQFLAPSPADQRAADAPGALPDEVTTAEAVA